MTVMGRTAKQGSYHSRDYEADVECHAEQCPVNDKRGHCGMSSAIRIGPDLKCSTGQKLIENPPPQRPKRPLDGD